MPGFESLRAAFAAAIIAVLAAAASQSAIAQDDGKARQAADFIQTLGQTAVTELADESRSEDERQQTFRDLLHEGFAMEAISRFVLGRYWRAASDEEQARFQDTFERVLTQRFLPLFQGYTDEDFEVTGAGPDPAQDSLYAVHTQIAQPGNRNAEKVRVTWRVRPKDDGFEIVDVVAEGVSMAITLRSEYGSALQSAGGNISQLIAMLKDNLAKEAYKPSQSGGSTN